MDRADNPNNGDDILSYKVRSDIMIGEDKDFVLRWYENNVWSRPWPSKICEGVGQIAIRDIPKNTSVYERCDRSVRAWVEWEDVKSWDEGLLRCVYDMQINVGVKPNRKDFTWKHEYGRLWMYTTKGLNWQSNWFFQNHSTNPNVDVEVLGQRDFKYITNRDIKEGEELLENYLDYDDWKEFNK